MYLYPVWIRIWHLLNALLFLILIFTGISMQYTAMDNSNYVVGFAKAVKWHNAAAMTMVANYVFFILGNAFTGNGKYYKLKKGSLLPDLAKQAKFYCYGIFKGEKQPFPVTEERKFNPLQKVTYVIAMYLGMPLLIISGFVLLFPKLAIKNIFGVSGLLMNDILHISMGFLLSIFMLIHIYTCTLGAKPGSLFRGIITGYHSSEED